MTLQSIIGLDLNSDLISSSVILDGIDEEIGKISDILVEDSGHFRYLIVRTGDWLSNRQLLVPVGICRSYDDSQKIAIVGITNKQDLEQLTTYESSREIDYDYEENLRQIYRQLMNKEDSETVSYERNSYTYDREPELYGMSGEETQTIRLYEERLVTDKERREVGEVTIGKRVETETEEVEIPVEKEKVVVKVKEVADEKIPVEPGEAKFEEGTVAKVKVYEETADVSKEAYVREEVEVKKEVEKEVVNAEETLRKEELEITGEENVELERE